MTVTRWPAIIAALPALWIVLQLMPLPAGGISRSIWDSAAATLGTPLWAGASIDPGMTVISMTFYLAVLAVGFVATGLSIDRTNAENLLFASGGSAAVSAIILTVFTLGGFAPLTSGASAALTAAAAYGAIYCAAITILILERFETRRGRDSAWSNPFIVLAVSTGGFALCCIAVVVAGAGHAIVAMCAGLACLAIIYTVRRLGLGPLAATALAVVAAFAVATVILNKAQPVEGDIAVRYAAAGPTELIATANRIIGEVGFAGAGAGAFDAIYRLYGASAQAVAPTFAAQLAIEIGRPALWIVVAMILALVLLCVRGAFSRGRDSFYSAAGAAAGVVMLIMMFGDPSTGNPAIAILLAATFGLALAQSVSRRL